MGKIFLVSIGAPALFIFGYMLVRSFAFYTAGDIPDQPTWEAPFSILVATIFSGSFIFFIYKK